MIIKVKSVPEKQTLKSYYLWRSKNRSTLSIQLRELMGSFHSVCLKGWKDPISGSPNSKEILTDLHRVAHLARTGRHSISSLSRPSPRKQISSSKQNFVTVQEYGICMLGRQKQQIPMPYSLWFPDPGLPILFKHNQQCETNKQKTRATTKPVISKGNAFVVRPLGYVCFSEIKSSICLWLSSFTLNATPETSSNH